MRVVVTGATGTLGRAVVAALRARGDQAVALSRDLGRSRSLPGDVELHEWARPQETPPPAQALAHADAVIHLLGEPVAQRWTDVAKGRIRDSRVLSTRNLVAGMRALDRGRPSTLVAQSATGYYGSHGDEWLDEDDPPGKDFLARLVVEWESESLAAAAVPGVRAVVTRTGVVISPDGGALAKMLPPFRVGVGGPVAGGRQYVPWVHIDDVAGALLHLVDTPAASGPVNLVAPHPVTNAELSHALGHVLHRPAVMPVPAFGVRALYGEMAMVVTTGQRVSAQRLVDLGYAFRQADLDGALRDVMGAAV